MKIDLDPSSMPELSRSNGSTGMGRTAEAVSDHTRSTPEDVAELSTDSYAVQRLKVQLAGVSDIRREKVESLRQAVGNGTFKASPERTAEAMLSSADRTPRQD